MTILFKVSCKFIPLYSHFKRSIL